MVTWKDIVDKIKHIKKLEPVKKRVKYMSLMEYAGELYGEQIDAEIRGIEFLRQAELDLLEEWAHTVALDDEGEME